MMPPAHAAYTQADQGFVPHYYFLQTLTMRSTTIRVRLLWLLLIVALPLAALLVWLQIQSERAAVQAVYARLSSVASARASVTAQYFEDQQEVLARIAQRPGVRRLDPTQCDAIITSYPQLHPDFTNLTLRYPNGDLICSYLPGAVSKMTPQALQVFGFSASAAPQGVSNVFIGPTSGRQLVGTTKRVLALQGDVHGHLLLGNDLLKTNPRMFAGVPADITVGVFDRNGAIVFRSRDHEKWVGKPVAKANRDIYSQKPDGQTVVTAIDGVRRMIAWTTIPGLGWGVTAGVSEAEAMGPYWQARKQALGFVALLLLAGVVLVYRVAQSINRPVRQLSDTAQRMGGGDLLVRATVSGPNELQALATQFNAMLDANEKTRAELKANEARWKFAIEGAGDGLWDWDVASGTVFFSPRWKTMLGHTEDEIGNGLNEWSSRLHPEDMASVMADLQPHLDGTIAQYTNEHRVLCKDGSYKWILDRGLVVARDTDGKPLRMVGTHCDITERKQTAEALRHTQALLANAEKIGQVGGWEIDIQTRLTTWTEGVYGIYELDGTDRLTVDQAINYYTPASRPMIEQAVQRAIEQGEPFDLELEIITAKGNLRNVHTVGKPDQARGKVTGFFQDITERKRFEAERATLETQLRESQKMEALGTLAGGIAHDFNNALATITINTELVRQDVGPGHIALESLEEINKAARRAMDLVQQILAFGRRQPLLRKPTTLSLVVLESARLVRATLPAGVTLKVECKADTPAVLADAPQIKQILLNLCGNAIHAVEDQERPGVVEVRLEVHAQDEARGDLQPGRYACLTVQDNGPGMDEATRARIFEPFFTTKPMGKGTGLGLSVVHGIVKAHEASIEVDSTPGKGSVFHIYFPAVDASVATATTAATTATPANGQGKHILYIDDEEAIVLLMQRLLERQGYRVSTFTNSEKALAAVRADPAQFDLAVTDHNMPGMSGLEVATALRDIRADLPVVLASGYITEELRAKAPAAGVRKLIYKPDTVDELCAAVAHFANVQDGSGAIS